MMYKEQPGRRVLVIGLDGATLDLIEPWVEEGKLPNFAKLMREGSYGRLESTLPPHTPVAWTSFMTGMNAGKHGIFDYLTRESGSYKFNPVNASYRRAKPVWTLVSESGGKVGVINVPMTYPPDKVEGFMISGMDTPGTDVVFTYPPDFLGEIERRFGKYIIDTPIYPHDKVNTPKFVREISKLADYRSKITLDLMHKHPWNLFIVVFVTPDRIQHDFWKYIDPAHPDCHSLKSQQFAFAIYDVYAQLDDILGRIMKQVDDDVNIIIMSDHGAGSCYQIIQLNEWLKAKGYLKYKEGLGKRKKDILTKINNRILEMRGMIPKWLRRGFKSLWVSRQDSVLSDSLNLFLDWKATKAYAEGTVGNIRINLEGREPEGTVAPGKDYEQLREELMVGLKELKDPQTGKRVIKGVYTREELYSGDQMNDLPDLIAVSEDGYRCVGNLKRLGIKADDRTIFRRDYWSGDHRIDGTLILYGPDIKSGYGIENAGIMDIAPTVLYLLGLPVPKEMDGQVLTLALEEDYLRHQPIRFRDSEKEGRNGSTEVSDYSAEDGEKIMERLRSLGYLE